MERKEPRTDKQTSYYLDIKATAREGKRLTAQRVLFVVGFIISAFLMALLSLSLICYLNGGVISLWGGMQFSTNSCILEALGMGVALFIVCFIRERFSPTSRKSGK